MADLRISRGCVRGAKMSFCLSLLLSLSLPVKLFVWMRWTSNTH